ncbi:uncharacterized protein BXIN_0325 [Babesia sp. Xinjiang]|uniref:uncharacterized protein n=1 Tax=Babesia sp. Xinjiang TaxID=462227 RepID=UPI000A237E0B|nr:uncharacterized protein BXIN_0282 [Babesia sp. Xinjiang]XP_028871600.1 uncharacterized protein BXIN_0325 [Babesia sp. Xinjiang]ORM41090.1 hypothetical protein BXIN_0282 [Babesia sp. Xinjiang]ORM41144.1 hypothetical protein BXIN_0325 [Babesia sp. Xinjiang]
MMKTHTSAFAFVFFLLCILNVQASIEDFDTHHGDSTPYSYFLESELDDTYENENEDNFYELMNDDVFGHMSLMDFDDEESFLEITEDDTDLDFGAFFQMDSPEDDVESTTFEDADEKFDDLIVLDDEAIEPDHTGYQPIRQHRRGVSCDSHNGTMKDAAVSTDDTTNHAFDEVSADEVKELDIVPHGFFRKNAFAITCFTIVIGVVLGYVLYKRGWFTYAKECVTSIFGSSQENQPVLPQVTEAEPLVNH